MPPCHYDRGKIVIFSTFQKNKCQNFNNLLCKTQSTTVQPGHSLYLTIRHLKRIKLTSLHVQMDNLNGDLYWLVYCLIRFNDRVLVIWQRSSLNGGGRPKVPFCASVQAQTRARVEPPTFRKLAG
jgi:hypothetical protein